MCTETTRSDQPTIHITDDGSYDPASGTYHTHFDASTNADAVVVAIVTAVATVTGRDPIEMPPLYATVDSEALTRIVRSSRDRPIEVSFPYGGCHVTVSSRGDVSVDPPDG